MQIKVGADPEIFVVNREGKFRSAHGLIPGDKKNPLRVEKGAVQVDGMALEFNIDPAESEDQFVDHVQTVMAQLRDMIAPKGYQLVVKPTAIFHGNHFRKQPEEAKELGCEPDFNAYSGEENVKPDNKHPMRTAAGHIHIGFCEDANPKDPMHLQRCMTLVRHLDAYLGIPSLLWDNDKLRRTMYGKAGCFRPKSYGVEYRTLSNQWLNSEALMRYVYRQTVKGVQSLMAGERFDENTQRNVRNYVDHSWSYYAKHFAGQHGMELPVVE